MDGSTFLTIVRTLLIGSVIGWGIQSNAEVMTKNQAFKENLPSPEYTSQGEIILIGGEDPPHDPSSSQETNPSQHLGTQEDIIIIDGSGTETRSAPPRKTPKKQKPPSPRYTPQAEFTLKPGNQRTVENIDVMIPIVSHPQNDLFFMDLRGVKDNKSSREFNAGLGYRHALSSWIVAGDPVILGGYGYYDVRRSPNGFTYRQGTMGFEALHPWWQARINGYYPDRHEHVVQGSPGYFSGYSYILSAGKEGAMPGFDFELGARLPLPSLPLNHEFFLFAGGYHFERKGYTTIQGPRFRAEYWIYGIFDWIGFPNARLKIGAETSHDPVRGTNNFLDLGLMIPLYVERGQTPYSYNSLDRTMTLPVVRDVDVVSATTSATLTYEGAPITIIHVDNNAADGGNGTTQAPYNNAQAGVDAAITQHTPNPVVYVHSGSTYSANGEAVVDIEGIPTSLKSLTLLSPAVTYIGDNGVIRPSGAAATFNAIDFTGFEGGSVRYTNGGAPLIINGFNLMGTGDATMGVSANTNSTMTILNSTVSSNGLISSAISATDHSTINVISSSAQSVGTDSEGVFSTNSSINLINSSASGGDNGVYGSGNSVINATNTTIANGVEIVDATVFNFINSSASTTVGNTLVSTNTATFYLYGPDTPTMTYDVGTTIVDRRPNYPWQY